MRRDLPLCVSRYIHKKLVRNELRELDDLHPHSFLNKTFTQPEHSIVTVRLNGCPNIQRLLSMSIPKSVQHLSRRTFLQYVGYGVGSALLARAGGSMAHAVDTAIGEPLRPWTAVDGKPLWTPVRYPLPLPGDAGNAVDDATRLATYEVVDDIQLPEGFTYDVVAKWGDVFGPTDQPEKQVRFGFNADYTGIVPIAGKADEYYLLVNHEYISARPWLQGFEQVHGKSPVDADGKAGGASLCDEFGIDLLDPEQTKNMNPRLLAAARQICAAGMSDLGVTVLHVKRVENGSFAVVKDAVDHFRIAGASTQNVPAGSMKFTGPAAAMLGEPRGTYANCSGATTPWGTFLTCEENFQDQVPELITADGLPLPGNRKRFSGSAPGHPTKLPFEFGGLGTGIEPPLDGRQYGWVCEIDPVHRTLKKHTSLGRFRHENVAIRCEAGKPLVCYMGDDRRGGHVWKFVSEGIVKEPTDPENSQLLEKGTLYVAKWTPKFTGTWVPLRPGTVLPEPNPAATTFGTLWMPKRPEGGHELIGVSRYDFLGAVSDFTSKVNGIQRDALDLSDTVDQTKVQDDAVLGVILMDAFAMANAVGGTPCARPEDVEVHPIDQSIYVAFTDSTGSGEGSPDVRIFPDSRGENSRQYGAIYRMIEDNNDAAGTTFKWGKFVSSGEAHEGGGGFACADNLAFDAQANLWMVCDITTTRHNFPVSRDEGDKTNPGNSGFVGVFGNNAMFMIPTAGEKAGQPLCFAIGPMECELTGPTFTDDGHTLLMSVQHPGEMNGTRGATAGLPASEERQMRLAARDGTLFDQTRTVPVGSNFPDGKGLTPKPCVVAIRRS